MYKIKDIAKILNVSDRTVEKSIGSHNRQMELILLSITNKNLLRSKSLSIFRKGFFCSSKTFSKNEDSEAINKKELSLKLSLCVPIARILIQCKCLNFRIL